MTWEPLVGQFLVSINSQCPIGYSHTQVLTDVTDRRATQLRVADMLRRRGATK